MTNQGSNEMSSDNEEIGEKKQKVSQISCMIDNVNTLEVLKSQHPQQNTFQFGSVTITSAFDSGNLARCEEGEEPNSYNMWIATDSLPYFKNCGYRTWFYFAVKGTMRDQTLSFTIKNMNHQSKLYAAGLRPVYRLGMNSKWKRCSEKCTWISTPEGTQVTFEHSFTGQERNETMMYIAFTYPFSYSETTEYFDKMQLKIKNEFADQIYIHRELLAYSLENRNVELITLTGTNGVSESEQEDRIDKLFPDINPDDEHRFSKERCKKITGKKCIFLSARVHPGEVQSTFVLNGILDFLMSNTKQSKILLENYIFKVIPLLNPDGVYRGYFRLDTYNHNLNRFYLDPNPQFQPTIYAARQAVIQQQNYGNLHIYLDLHGHAVKKGCFIFGNALKGEDQAQNMVFAKLISLNCLNFDFAECSFAEKLMSVKDKGCGLSREGSGRVGIYKATGQVMCYTLECNFQTGRRINHLTPKINVETGEIEPEIPITDPNHKMYRENKTPNYTIEIFEDVGRAVCLALLDLIEKNPVSRLLSSQYKNVSMKIDNERKSQKLPRTSQSANYRLISTTLNQSSTATPTGLLGQPYQNQSNLSLNSNNIQQIKPQQQITRNNSTQNSTINRPPIVYQERTPKNPNTAYSSHSQKFTALKSDKKKHSNSQLQQFQLSQQQSFVINQKNNQLINSMPLEEIKEKTKKEQQSNRTNINLTNQNKSNNKDKITKNQEFIENDDSRRKSFVYQVKNDISEQNVERVNLATVVVKDQQDNYVQEGNLQDDPYFKYKKIQSNMQSNTSEKSQSGKKSSYRNKQNINQSQKNKITGLLSANFNSNQGQELISSQPSEFMQTPMNGINQNGQNIQSSHHFKTSNSVFLPQNAIAPNSAQALYHLSQGGNKLVPKLLEKHSMRVKSQVPPVNRSNNAKQPNTNISLNQNINAMISQDDQRYLQQYSNKVQDQILQYQSRKQQSNTGISQTRFSNSQNIQQLSFSDQQAVQMREKPNQQINTQTKINQFKNKLQGKRIINNTSNNIWNKIKSSSFNQQNLHKIEYASEAAE
eukprot:403345634